VSVECSDDKSVPGYSSNQPASMTARDHGWHVSSKQHGYGASAPSSSQWSSRGTPSSADVSARSDWSGRGAGSSSAGGGSSFASAAKNVMSAATSRAPMEARYDAYKHLTNSATRRY